MPSRTHILGCSGFAAGLVGTIGYRIDRADATALVARTTAGITQVAVGTATSVAYRASVTIDDANLPAFIVWDDGNNVAVDVIGAVAAGGGSGGGDTKNVTIEGSEVRIG
jgi:hypothetical protein